MAPVPQRIKVSVVMPSMNEEKAIGPMIEQIRKNAADFDLEIVLVDSSKDNTPEIARSMGAVVLQQPPRGHGVALREAIRSAAHDVVITSDCDNTYPMEFIPRLVRMVAEEGCDIVSCNRLTRELGQEMPAANRLANWAFAFMVRHLYGIPVHDVTTGMFCMRRQVAQGIDWETNYSFPAEIVIRSHLAGFKLREVDIPYRLRIGEVTLNRWRSGKAYLRCIFKYKFGLKFASQLL